MNCFKVLDFVATKVRECFDNSTKNKDITLDLPFLSNPELIDYLDLEHPTNDEVKSIRKIYHKSITISIKEFNKFYSTKKMTTRDLKRVSELISSKEYSTNLSYRIRTCIGKKLSFQYRYKITKPTYLCKMELVGGKKGSDGRLCGAAYKFTFDTILGGMFLHNIWSGEVATIPDYLVNQFYSLNTYPSYLFRKYLLHLNHDISVKISSRTIVKELGLTNNHSNFLNNQISNYIKHLQKNNLVICTEINTSYDNNVFFKLRRCKETELSVVKQKFEESNKNESSIFLCCI